jgi:RsiW-degrading membrane proteinase PrsW (M82 family)
MVNESNKVEVQHKRCTPWCAPLIIYIILCLLYLIIVGVAIFKSKKEEGKEKVKLSSKLSVLGFIFLQQLLVGLLYAFLCYRCWNTAAWILLLLPLIIIGIYLFIMLMFIGATIGAFASLSSKS